MSKDPRINTLRTLRENLTRSASVVTDLIEGVLDNPCCPPIGWTTLDHFNAAIEWDNALDCLRWACENGATVAEMRAWRRALRGEDLSIPESEA